MRLNFYAFCLSIVMALVTGMYAADHPALQYTNYNWLASIVMWGINFLNSLIDASREVNLKT